MARKLATVILPTHSDPGTLGYAISSVLSQTESRLELIIVLDGATPATRVTAQKWANLDPRVRVLDLPKGRGRGAENRHLAVLSAESKVIFYIDEDDLWLPGHVSLMLAKVKSQKADVVCSTVASVGPDNVIEVAPFSHASGPLRESLSVGAWRALFKIHMCHTKTCYERLPEGWKPRADGEIVMSLMMQLADKQFKWAPIHEVTALSFHGTPRRDAGLSPQHRSRQVRKYLNHIINHRIQGGQVIRRASIVYYFVSVLHHLDPAGSSLEEYLDKIEGINVLSPSTGKTKFLENPSDKINFPFSKEQTEIARAILNYRAGKEISPKIARLMYRSLTKIVCGPPIWSPKQGITFVIGSLLGKYFPFVFQRHQNQGR